MGLMTIGGKRKFNWIVFVTGFGLFSLLWPSTGFIWGFLASVAGVIVVFVIQDAVRRRTSP